MKLTILLPWRPTVHQDREMKMKGFAVTSKVSMVYVRIQSSWIFFKVAIVSEHIAKSSN